MFLTCMTIIMNWWSSLFKSQQYVSKRLVLHVFPVNPWSACTFTSVIMCDAVWFHSYTLTLGLDIQGSFQMYGTFFCPRHNRKYKETVSNLEHWYNHTFTYPAVSQHVGWISLTVVFVYWLTCLKHPELFLSASSPFLLNSISNMNKMLTLTLIFKH